MFIFVWDYQSKMTSNYHNSGGAVAVTKSLEIAREMLKKDDNVFGERVADLAFMTKEPTFVYEAPDHATEYYCLFPDAGCC